MAEGYDVGGLILEPVVLLRNSSDEQIKVSIDIWNILTRSAFVVDVLNTSLQIIIFIIMKDQMILV